MRIKHLTPSDYRVSRWSGGTTTQLCIAPEGADYAHRDFLWRVSSATVELEASDFTMLPDYHRWITTLEGTLAPRLVQRRDSRRSVHLSTQRTRNP